MNKKLLSVFSATAALLLSGCAGVSTTGFVDIEEIRQNPNNHRGELIGIFGQIIAIQNDAGGNTTIQVLDQSSPSGTTFVIHFPYHLGPRQGVQQNFDCWVLMRVTGQFEGTNAYGGSVRSIAGTGLAIKDSAGGFYDDSDIAVAKPWMDGKLSVRRQ